MASAPYDGFVSVSTIGGAGFYSEIQINDVVIARASGADYANNSCGSAAFRKGDKVTLTGNISASSYNYVCFYKKRDYSNR